MHHFLIKSAISCISGKLKFVPTMEESAQAEMADFLEIIFGDWSNPNAYMDKPISNIDHPCVSAEYIDGKVHDIT